MRRYLGYCLFGLKTTFVAFAALSLSGCIFSMEPCDERHSAVKRMRAFSQQELAGIYDKVMGYREVYQDKILLSKSDPPIPEDLKMIKAMRFWYGGPSDSVFVTLTKCNVSEGINLRFETAEFGPPRIEMDWRDYSSDQPYATKSEILWSE